MSDYGTAACTRAADGTVLVERADRVIGMTRECMRYIQALHPREDDYLQLDTAGEYLYRFYGFDQDVVVFTRVDPRDMPRIDITGTDGDHLTSAPNFRLGFDLAKRLPDPEFRAWLTGVGWRSGDTLVPCQASSTVQELVARTAHREGKGLTWLIYEDASQPQGMRIVQWEAK